MRTNAIDHPIAPMLAKLAESAPATGNAFEIKWDGVRCLAYVRKNSLELLSRNNLSITSSYPELTALARQFKRGDAILDGEIVALDNEGKPDFSLLQTRMHVRDTMVSQRLSRHSPVTYMIFDLLQLNGEVLLDRPYLERRRRLEALKLKGAHWATPEYFLGDPDELRNATREMGMEGLVAKRLDSPYTPGKRTGDWLKLKNTSRQEFIIGGWEEGQGSRANVLGAVLMGYYDCSPQEARQRQRAQRLVYAGKVGTGFSNQLLDELSRDLSRRETPKNPFELYPPRGRHIHYARPELVAEVSYAAWTHTHMLRHASFQGLRTDKPAAQVVREDVPKE